MFLSPVSNTTMCIVEFKIISIQLSHVVIRNFYQNFQNPRQLYKQLCQEKTLNISRYVTITSNRIYLSISQNAPIIPRFEVGNKIPKHNLHGVFNKIAASTDCVISARILNAQVKIFSNSIFGAVPLWDTNTRIETIVCIVSISDSFF